MNPSDLFILISNLICCQSLPVNRGNGVVMRSEDGHFGFARMNFVYVDFVSLVNIIYLLKNLLLILEKKDFKTTTNIYY